MQVDQCTYVHGITTGIEAKPITTSSSGNKSFKVVFGEKSTWKRNNPTHWIHQNKKNNSRCGIIKLVEEPSKYSLQASHKAPAEFLKQKNSEDKWIISTTYLLFVVGFPIKVITFPTQNKYFTLFVVFQLLFFHWVTQQCEPYVSSLYEERISLDHQISFSHDISQMILASKNVNINIMVCSPYAK